VYLVCMAGESTLMQQQGALSWSKSSIAQNFEAMTMRVIDELSQDEGEQRAC
jgi:hypothetical protein